MQSIGTDCPGKQWSVQKTWEFGIWGHCLMINMVVVLGWPLDLILNIFYKLNNSVILRMNSTSSPWCPHSVTSPAHCGFPWNNQHCPRQNPCLLHTWRVTLARVHWNQAPSWCSTCVYLFLALRVTSLLASVCHKTQVLHLVALIEPAWVFWEFFCAGLCQRLREVCL